jgi:hypothetical protein
MREKPQGMEVECSFRAGGPRFEEIKKLKTVISKVGDGNTCFYFWQRREVVPRLSSLLEWEIFVRGWPFLDMVPKQKSTSGYKSPMHFVLPP